MSMRRFKTLIAIAELGTFTKAANAVYLTPSAVSQQMTMLEGELGLSLFDRSKRPPKLTPTGYALIPKAKHLLRIYSTLKQVDDTELEPVEHLSVGTVPTAITGIMPKALKALQKKNDNLHVHIYPGLSDDLYAQVERGFLDAAIISHPPTINEGLHWQSFIKEPLVVLASAQIKSNDPREILETQAFIRFNRKAWVGKIIDQWLMDNHICVHEKMELDTLEAISVMVMNKLGVSIVPMSCFSLQRHVSLKAITLEPPPITRELGVLCHRDSRKRKLVSLLTAELKRIADKSI